MLEAAVATSDGISIDVPFGQARSFHIFDVAEDGTFHLFEQREILPGSSREAANGRHAGATIEQLATNFDMAMHVLGLEKDDFIPEVKDVLGVATFFEQSKGGQTLFI